MMMISRTELNTWQSYRDYPSVSILAPTHRTAPSNKQDPIKAKSTAIVLVGVERNLAFYKEVTRHNKSIVGMLAGNHDRASPSQLGKLVWSVFDAGATLRRTEALMQLHQAVSANRHASGIDQVWRAAKNENCRTLLVEKGFKYPADVSPDGDRLLKYTAKGRATLDDAVDEIVEKVMVAGGEVFFYSGGDLDVHHRIAAVLRR